MSDVEKGSYGDLLSGIKARMQTARVRAGLAANQEMILLYWDIGKLVAERQAEEGWAASVIDRLSADIRREFPDIKGFSSRNIRRMKLFYQVHNEQVVNWPQPVAKIERVESSDIPSMFRIPWAHNVLLLEKVKDADEREWYIQKTIEHGWSRNMLALHIDQGDYERIHNPDFNYGEFAMIKSQAGLNSYKIIFERCRAMDHPTRVYRGAHY